MITSYPVRIFRAEMAGSAEKTNTYPGGSSQRMGVGIAWPASADATIVAGPAPSIARIASPRASSENRYSTALQ